MTFERFPCSDTCAYLFCLFSFHQPGIAYSVVYRDSVLKSRGLGVLNRTAKPATPPDGSTIFRIGSVSKVFAVSYHFSANNIDLCTTL